MAHKSFKSQWEESPCHTDNKSMSYHALPRIWFKLEMTRSCTKVQARKDITDKSLISSVLLLEVAETEIFILQAAWEGKTYLLPFTVVTSTNNWYPSIQSWPQLKLIAIQSWPDSSLTEQNGSRAGPGITDCAIKT